MPTIQVKKGRTTAYKEVNVVDLDGVPSVHLEEKCFEPDQLRQMANDLEAKTWETTVKDADNKPYVVGKSPHSGKLRINAPCGEQIFFDKENAETLIKQIKEVMDITKGQ